MTVTEKACFAVNCNDCGSDLEYDEFRPVFDSAEQARSLLADVDWWSDGTVDICDECKDKPHAFVPEPPAGDWTCARCGNDQDDHEPVLTSGGAK